jgi:peptidoglycan/xylan/chitin deacetylase (PgdA/CDA1 family)
MDWASPPVATMVTNLEQQLKPGSIVVLHDGIAETDPADPKATDSRQNTVELVEKILATYTAEGYRFVTVSELLEAGEALPSLQQCQKRPTA